MCQSRFIAVSLDDLYTGNAEKPNERSNRSKIVGIRSRKNYKRFIFHCKSSETWSSRRGHLTSVFYPEVTRENVLRRKSKGTPTNSQVLVWCSCPAFHYWGSHYWATQQKYLMFDKKKETRFPIIRDPEGENLICKHVARVSKYLRRTSFRNLVRIFDMRGGRTGFASPDDLMVVGIEKAFPCIEEFLLREGNIGDPVQVDEIMASIHEDNYESVLEHYGVII